MNCITTHLSIFDECFGARLTAQEAHDKLFKAPLKRQADFTIHSAEPKRAPLGWIGSALMIPLCPAQSGLAKWGIGKLHPRHLDQIRAKDLKEIEREGTHYAKEVTLEKNGVRYSGLMMGRIEHLTNGNWILQAMGRDCPIERAARKCRSIYSETGFNVLMVNGPSIGHSQGEAAPYTLGEAQEAGICFLESAVRAKKVVLAGHSLGGAAIGQAVLQHRFKKGVQYLVVNQTTFDRAGNVAKHYFPYFKEAAKVAIMSHGLEMDLIEASKKLSRLGIKEIVIQTSHRAVPRGEVPRLEDFASDGVIAAEASLGYGLVREGVLGHKVFRCIPGLGHTDSQRYLEATREEVAAYFKPRTLLSRLGAFFAIP